MCLQLWFCACVEKRTTPQVSDQKKHSTTCGTTLHPPHKALANITYTRRRDSRKSMAERNTATATIERQNESLPALFARLTNELMQLVDAKLELLKTELRQEAGAYDV